MWRFSKTSACSVSAVGLALQLIVLSATGAAEPKAAGKLDLSIAPAEALIAIYMRPAELAKVKMAEPVVAAFDELMGSLELDFSVAEFTEFQFAMLKVQGGDRAALMVRTATPRDWNKYYQKKGFADANLDGRTGWKLNGADIAVLADDRTLVIGQPDAALRLVEGLDPNDRAEWTDRWREAVKRPLAGMMQMSIVSANGKQNRQVYETLAKEAKFAVMHGEVTAEGLRLTGVIETASADAAARVAPAAAQVLVDFATMIVEGLNLPPDDSDKLTAQLSALIGGGELSTRGRSIDIKGLVTPEMLKVFSDSALQAGGR